MKILIQKPILKNPKNLINPRKNTEMTTKPTIDWRKMPFVRLLICLVTGIVAAEYAPYGTPLSIGVAMVLAIVASIVMVFVKLKFQHQWLFGAPLSISLFVMGYALVFFQNEKQAADYFGKQLNPSDYKTGHIVLAKITDATEREKNFRLIVSVEKMGTSADSMQDATGNLLIYWRKDSLDTPPQYMPTYGDLIVLNGSIQIIEPPKNPDAFDFQQYWHRQNVHHQTFIDGEDVQLLAQGRGHPIIQWANQAQTHLLYILKTHLPTEREFAVGSALLLGYRDAVTPDVRDAYVETGSMHLLAVSGMHVIILFQMMNWVLDRYKSGSRRWRWIKAIVAIVVVCIFSILTGLTASVLRAATMSAFLAIGKALQNRPNAYNILGSSAFGLLLWNPLWLFDVGFQLSFLAVGGIVFFQPLLFKLWIFKIDDDTPFAKPINKSIHWMGESLATGFAAQLVVTPISLFYFHQFPTYFWLSSVVGVFLSNMALMVGVALFCLSGISVLCILLGKILFGLLWILNEFIFLLQKFPFSVFDGFWVSALSTVLAYAIIFGIAMTLSERRLRAFFTPLSIIVVLSAFYAFSTIRQSQQRQIVLYHVYKNTVVDFIEGNQCLSFSSVDNQDIEGEKRQKFAVQKHRIKLKINKLHTYPLDTLIKVDNLYWQNRCVQFYDKKILFIDRMPPPDLTVAVDYVVIHNNPKIDLQALAQQVKFQQIIFDASNSRYKVEMWKNLCITNNYPHYDIQQQGAFVLDF
jgi:competence protein ComEC